MLPELKPNQNVFLEITNLTHGGSGWEFGRCLWSPVRDRGGADAWGIMRSPAHGDLIIHLAKKNNGYHWYGISLVDIPASEFIDEPTIPGDWVNMSPYYRIGLEQYQQITEPPHIQALFAQFDLEFRSVMPYEGTFYVSYGATQELRMAQKYLAIVPESIYQCFNIYSTQLNFYPIFNQDIQIPTNQELVHPDFEAPGRIPTLVSRIIRDTALVRQIKNDYHSKCQICGYQLMLPNDRYYSEGHHLHPLGGVDGGPDIRENIILLCPTHHAEFDYASIAIDENNIIRHIDENNEFHQQELAYQRTDLGSNFIKYHFEKRFKK